MLLRCSHGLIFEMKCLQCGEEAMARVKFSAEIEPVKNPEPVGAGSDLSSELREVLAQSG